MEYPNTKKIWCVAVILALLASTLTGSYYFQKYKQAVSLAQNPQKSFGVNMVRPQDRRPLVIPPETIKNGRALAIPILMYHHVGDLPQNADALRKDLTVPSANFEQQVAWLSQNGYTGISLRGIYLLSLGKFVMPKKPVVFTFDDGYADVFTNAVPILKKYGFTGSFAIITQNPGTTQAGNDYAPWHDIANAYQAGEEITSHTQNHFDGTDAKFSSDYIFQNLSGSVSDIKNHLGFAPNILVYPYGHYSSRYIAQAKKAGFVMGITVREGKLVNLDDLMEIPRLRVHGAESLDKFEEVILK